MHLHAIALLRGIHVLAGTLWVGAAVLNTFYVLPAVIAAGPAGGQVMRVLVQVRRLPAFMNTVSLVAIASGLALYWWSSGGLNAAWLASTTGVALTLGGLLALATAGFGHAIVVPSAKRLAGLGAEIAAAGGPPSPAQAAEIAALQARMLRASRIAATLLVAATLLMGVARYL